MTEQPHYPSGADPTIECSNCGKMCKSSQIKKERHGRVGTPAEKVRYLCPECSDE